MMRLKKFINFIGESKLTNADFSSATRKWFNKFTRVQKDMILNALDDFFNLE